MMGKVFGRVVRSKSARARPSGHVLPCLFVYKLPYRTDGQLANALQAARLPSAPIRALACLRAKGLAE